MDEYSVNHSWWTDAYNVIGLSQENTRFIRSHIAIINNQDVKFTGHKQTINQNSKHS